MENTDAFKYYFHLAETNYASGNCSVAVRNYRKAYELSQGKSNKIKDLSLEGMMACASPEKLKGQEYESNIQFIYQEFLKNYPNSKKSYVLYQRLFSENMRKGDITSAEQTLSNFKKYFPSASSKQEAMIAQITDYHKKQGNVDAIKKWVARINSGEFQVSANYAKKLNLYLLTTRFEGVEKATSKGEKARALRGYVQIYKDAESSDAAKRNASYNIMVLFHELGDVDKTLGWAERSLDHMDRENFNKFSESYMLIAADLFGRRRFKQSIDLYEKILNKQCKSVGVDNTFKNAFLISLAIHDHESASRLLNRGQECGVSKVELSNAKVELISFFSDEKKWVLLESLYNREKTDTAFQKSSISYLFRYYQFLKKTGDDYNGKDIKHEIEKIYRSYKKNLDLDSLDVISHFKLEELEILIKGFESQKLVFPDNVFNAILKRKFELLEKITTNSVDILGIGSGKGIVKTYALLAESYQKFISEIESFKIPSDKSEHYKDSFTKSMSKVTGPLKSKVREFFKEARDKIERYQILSTDNSLFLDDEALKIKKEYRPIKGGILMDRWGRR